MVVSTRISQESERVGGKTVVVARQRFGADAVIVVGDADAGTWDGQGVGQFVVPVGNDWRRRRHEGCEK